MRSTVQDDSSRGDVPPATATARGLSTAEAATLARTWGPNLLPRGRMPTLPRRIGRELLTPVNGVLAAAAVLSGSALGSWTEAAVIVAIIAAATALAVSQEVRADTAVEALDQLLSPTASVWRDGVLQVLPADVLVPGDVVVLSGGDRVPADARLLEAQRLVCDEAILTGEAEPAAKDPDRPSSAGTNPADRDDMVFAGTMVLAGRGIAEVEATGAHTEAGQIASQLAARTATPLERELASLVGRLTQISLAVGAVLAALLLARGTSVGQSLVAGVALAVAAIPEGLGAVGVATLALGARRLARRGAITRRLPALEALGVADVLCCDKTGTLTTGQLSVVAADAADLRALWASVARCHDAADGQGDPVDVTLAAEAEARGAPPPGPRLSTLPYDPAARLMATVVEEAGGPVVTVKGAPEVVLARGRPSPALERAATAAETLAVQGLRVLAVASGRGADLEAGDLDVVGVVGLGDPLRPSTVDAVDACRRAGVRVVMVTGDRPDTAAAVARQAGIDVAEVVVGSALSLTSPAERRSALRRADVVARVDPVTKRELVAAHQGDGRIVIMTGDGVNDGPALAAADVGVALAGGSGTDVARAAADLVVTSGDLGTLVDGIREGRRVRRNLIDCLTYLLAGNAAGAVAVMGGLVLVPDLATPLAPVQLLWANLVADGVVALAFATDDPPGDHLKATPAGAAPLLSTRRLLGVAGRGMVVGLAVLAAAALGLALGWSQPAVQAALLLNLLAARAGLALAVRSQRHGLERSGLRGPVLRALGASAVLQALAFATPWGRSALHLAALPGPGWAIAGATMLATIAIAWAVKLRSRQG